MSTPGVSLFQGTESIKVNTSLDIAQEEEEIEDQRRRNEELGNILQNAFDDLDDDDTTIDSTTNFQSQHSSNNNNNHHHQYQQNAAFSAQNAASNESNEVHKLKMLLESKMNELETIQQISQEDFRKRDELQKRLMIAEAELDRALAAKGNTHELLVESKERCSNLENVITKIRNEKKDLETENNALLGKLETTQTLLADMQRKYDMVERDRNKHSDRNAELRRRQMEEHHRAEIEVMQQQMEQLTNKLEKKTNELENMNTRYHALQNSNETMLIDKASKINDLTNALSEAQKQCEELLSKQDYFQENIRLQKLVANLQDQIEAMEKTINTLQERLEFTTAELDIMDSVLQQHNREDTTRHLSDIHSKDGSTPLSTTDRVGHLKNELYRALANVKEKRETIRKLQQSLDEKNAEIRTLKAEENNALVQITTLKEDKLRLENRLKILEEENDEFQRQKFSNKSLNASQAHALEDEVKRLRQENAALEQRRQLLEQERNNKAMELKKLDAQMKNLEVDLEELKQERDSFKLNYEQMLEENESLRNNKTEDNTQLELEKHKILLKDAQFECDRLKNLYVEISNAKEAMAFEVQKLRDTDSIKELQEQQEKVDHLQRAFQLAELKSTELSKMLESEKLCHEREVTTLREQMEKVKTNNYKTLKNNTNDCIKCMEYIAQIKKFELQNLELTNCNFAHKQEINELTLKLNDAKALAADLTDKLKLSEHQEKLIKQLKTKAHQFEEYIKSQNNSSEKSGASSNERSVQTCNKSVETSLELQRADITRIESRIRDEMAKIFAAELKRFQIENHQLEEKTLCLQREYQNVSGELQQRHTEVDLLKQAILAEREKMEEILTQKESETKSVLHKQNAILHKCRDELKAKNEKINNLVKELEERQTQIEAERQSMKAVMSQWEQQRKNTDDVEREWKTKLEELKQIHESAIAAWQTKYNSAKRTAANYKRYSEDKEAHMIKEYERIKYEYDASLVKIEARMNEALSKKRHENKEAANKHERDLNQNKENKAKN